MLKLKRNPRFDPRPPRQSAAVAASLLCADGDELAVRLSNISENGCAVHVRGGHALQADDWVGILLPGYAIIRCQVRWCDDGNLGLRFAQPIPLDWLT